MPSARPAHRIVRSRHRRERHPPHRLHPLRRAGRHRPAPSRCWSASPATPTPTPTCSTSATRSRTALDQGIDGLDPAYRAVIGADFASDVRAQLSNLTSNLLFGLIAVAVVSFLLIGWRTAIVTAVFMATVMLVTMIGLWTIGYTLNTITFFALVLTLGLLVDDAIVISESIDASRDGRRRHSRRGPPASASCAAPSTGSVPRRSPARCRRSPCSPRWRSSAASSASSSARSRSPSSSPLPCRSSCRSPSSRRWAGCSSSAGDVEGPARRAPSAPSAAPSGALARYPSGNGAKGLGWPASACSSAPSS